MCVLRLLPYAWNSWFPCCIVLCPTYISFNQVRVSVVGISRKLDCGFGGPKNVVQNTNHERQDFVEG